MFITDRDRPAHVLLSIADNERLTGGARKIADALAMSSLDEIEIEIEFDPPRIDIQIRSADLS